MTLVFGDLSFVACGEVSTAFPSPNVLNLVSLPFTTYALTPESVSLTSTTTVPLCAGKAVVISPV